MKTTLVILAVTISAMFLVPFPLGSVFSTLSQALEVQQ